MASAGVVREQAIEEGLDVILEEAGFDFRQPGCSMCLAMNADKLGSGERCASTSNRNFEGRQGAGGRTHLMSPMMAAAAAVSGTLADVRAMELPPEALATLMIDPAKSPLQRKVNESPLCTRTRELCPRMPLGQYPVVLASVQSHNAAASSPGELPAPTVECSIRHS